MKKNTIADGTTSAGTKDSKRTNADDSSFSPTGAKPSVMRRFVISKELFVETIEKIKQQHNHDLQCAEKLKDVFPNAFTANLMYENHLIMNQLVKLLQVQLNDENEHSWIEYFMWELDFGAKNDKYKATDKNGNNIPLLNASELYDLLTN